MNEKEIVKMIYGIEIKNEGIEAAFKKNMEIIKSSEKESRKKLKREFKKEAPIEFAKQLADTKLQFIKWSLMFNNNETVKEALPFLIKEIRNVADELEEFINE